MSYASGYSDLEVSHTEWDEGKEVIIPAHGYGHPARNIQPQQVQQPAIAPGTSPDHLSYHNAYSEGSQEKEHAGDLGIKTSPRTCGISRTSFRVVILVTGLVIIGAIVGGVVGGLAAKNAKGGTGVDSGNGNDPTVPNPDPNHPSNSTTTTVPGVLTGSRLSAINWTGVDSVDRHAVFYQDSWDCLMVSLWDAKTTAWTSINISQKLTNVGSPIKAKSGTPLAGTAVTAQYGLSVSLFYLSSSSTVGQVSSVDAELGVWAIGDLSKQGGLKATDTSQLAAVSHFCNWGCAQLTYVIFEDDNQSIRLANSSNWGSEASNLVNRVDPSSALTLIPFTAQNGNNVTNAYELRIYYDSNSQTEELKFSIDHTWSQGQQLVSGLSIWPKPTQFAATSFITGSKGKVLVVALQGNETLISSYYDPGTYWQTGVEINFDGHSAVAFSAIAMNGDQRFYGLANNTIHEYQWQLSEPLQFLYAGNVLTPSSN
ncbi:hypothetical protein GQ53DRAFT_845034 [Thozetella sp. PMI_491]|nr:hypothetical protein GQ53DRAFT_845034 [Thozetella sp. PMI_491]